MADETFVTITNKDIYKKLINIEKTVNLTNGTVKMNRKWLWSLTTTMGTGFLFLVGTMMRIVIK